MTRTLSEFLVAPDPLNPALTETVQGIDHEGQPVETKVPVERPLTLYLNGQEIVTMMTIGDYPEYLALGYLANQRMLMPEDEVNEINLEPEIETIVVRTARITDYEERLKKKILTSGCAMGTVFGNMMDAMESVTLDPDARLHTSWIYALSKKINLKPSLYLEAGAIHGCVLCEEDRPLVYMEDVGRHNAIDKIAGYMRVHGISAAGKTMYTTGRLTSEMVMKTAQMGIPILISRSGFTAWGVQLARQIGMTLIGRAKGKRFVALAGAERLQFDADPAAVTEEPVRSQRKGGRDDEAA